MCGPRCRSGETLGTNPEHRNSSYFRLTETPVKSCSQMFHFLRCLLSHWCVIRVSMTIEQISFTRNFRYFPPISAIAPTGYTNISILFSFDFRTLPLRMAKLQKISSEFSQISHKCCQMLPKLPLRISLQFPIGRAAYKVWRATGRRTSSSGLRDRVVC